MKLKKIFILIAFAVTYFKGIDLQAQEVVVALDVATAGTLSTLIESKNKNLITYLRLTGYLNGDDICYIREMAGCDANDNHTSGSLSELDLSGANIVSGGSAYYSTGYYTSTDSISDYMFYDCNKLKSITLPNSLTYIGRVAFYKCTGLTSINIPISVTSIENGAFYDCTGLTQIIVDCINSDFSSLDGVLFNKDRTSLIFCPNGKIAQYIIPGSVTSIGSLAFIGCTGLTSITIPNSVTSVESRAFYGCTGLTQIVVDSNNSNFSSLDGLLFNKDTTSLIFCPSGKTTQYTIPGSVTTIGEGAFACCAGLTSITIPNSVTTIGGSAFYGCTGLSSIYIPNSITSIGDATFSNCTGLNSITIPGCVTSIEEFAFSGCSGLTSVTIPNSVTYIEGDAFSGCTGLTSVTFGNSVTDLGYDAFCNCTGLTEIHCKMTTPITIASEVFAGVNKSTCKLYVPKGSYGSYSKANIWKDFTNIIEEDVITPINKIKTNNATVYAEQNNIVVKGANKGETISVYTTKGTLVQNIKATNEVRINVPSNQIYLVRIAGKTFKVAL